METYVNHELPELHILFGSPSAAWHVQTRQADADPPSKATWDLMQLVWC